MALRGAAEVAVAVAAVVVSALMDALLSYSCITPARAV